MSGDPSDLLAVIDPVDGSTNAHRGVPFYSTSICVLDSQGPLMGLVVNQASGVRYAAVRGQGAERDGKAIRPSGCQDLASAIVGISGFPGRYPGWAQFRALGAASLECCAVAEGVLDAYTMAGRSTLYGWDYLAGLLICREAGAAEAERDGADLVVRDSEPRRPGGRGDAGSGPVPGRRGVLSVVTEGALLARKTWRTLEPLHGMIYFVPEAAEAYGRLGIRGRAGYFASRAAAMGAVPADVVVHLLQLQSRAGASRHS